MQLRLHYCATLALLATIPKLLRPGALRVTVAASWLRASATFEVARILRVDFLVAWTQVS